MQIRKARYEVDEVQPSFVNGSQTIVCCPHLLHDSRPDFHPPFLSKSKAHPANHPLVAHCENLQTSSRPVGAITLVQCPRQKIRSRRRCRAFLLPSFHWRLKIGRLQPCEKLSRAQDRNLFKRIQFQQGPVPLAKLCLYPHC